MMKTQTDTHKAQEAKMATTTKKLKLVQAFTKTYEFLPEIWQRIKEYAVPEYVEPIKIGERFIHYDSDFNPDTGRRTLGYNQIKLCERVQNTNISRNKNVPWIAKYRVLQTLWRKGYTEPKKSVITRMDKRDMAEVPDEELEWLWWLDLRDPDDFILKSSLLDWRKTFDPTLEKQFIKTNVKKLHRSMFSELEDI
jgi:hypothetical protein